MVRRREARGNRTARDGGVSQQKQKKIDESYQETKKMLIHFRDIFF
jgi:hypothetical protein